jgi:Scaffold protein Nfu/NifU N terminal
MKFTLDAKLPGMFNVAAGADTQDNPFVAEVLAADGVAAVFGVNDFVTVTRQPGAEWDPIVAAVRAAAEAHL